jgi:hypothetical protein
MAKNWGAINRRRRRNGAAQAHSEMRDAIREVEMKDAGLISNCYLGDCGIGINAFNGARTIVKDTQFHNNGVAVSAQGDARIVLDNCDID